jgi:DNA replication protein DnaC
MLTENTIRKLYEMRLNSMAQIFRDQMIDNVYASMLFEERFGLLVDSEWSRRRNNRLARLIKKAGYVHPQACTEDINYAPSRHLDKGQITRLSFCNYIQDCNNVIILGATGTGKSYLSCALGVAANRNFYSSRYIRLPDLFAELAIARGEGNFLKIITEYKKVKLLILDEWLLLQLTTSETRDLLEIVEARSGRGSTIFCSQFEVNGWYQKIGDETIADAICDRIIHNAYTILLKGDSLRKMNTSVERE